MKKTNQQYSTFTSYLTKTNKNVDMYRLYNPDFVNSSNYDHKFEIKFYDTYFKRHSITKRNLLTMFAIHSFKLSRNDKNINVLPHLKSYLNDKTSFVKFSMKLFSNRIKFLSNNIDNLNVSFRGGNVIFISQFGKKEEISYFTLSRIAGDIYDIIDFSMNNQKLLVA